MKIEVTTNTSRSKVIKIEATKKEVKEKLLNKFFEIDNELQKIIHIKFI